MGTLVQSPLKEKYYMTFLVLSTAFFIAGGKPRVFAFFVAGGKPCKLSEPLRTGELCI
jgi:hypothetical protein